MAAAEMEDTRKDNGEEMGGKRYIMEEDIEPTVLDFDMLCATVALQTHGFSVEKKRRTKEEDQEDEEDGDGDIGGVQRMWEGGVLDCFEDHRIAIETACCPCYRFGKNMARASLGSCLLQVTVYGVLVLAALCNLIAFGVTNQHCFLYLGLAFIVTLATYLGYFRTRIRKQFNIRGSTSSFGDCLNHLICPCCTLCQEARTLEMNNVQGGVWCGRGDTICIGSYGEGNKALSEPGSSSLFPTKSPGTCTTSRSANGLDHSWTADVSHSEPLVSTPTSK